MFGKARRGRVSLRDQRIAVKRALDFMADSSGRPRMDIALPAPKRERVKRESSTPLEKEVLADILQALRRDPRVAIVDRRQSGLFVDGDRYIKVGSKGTLDISGMLHGGRYFEIEAKRPGERPDENQQRRIEMILSYGGVAGYATSAIQAIALLP